MAAQPGASREVVAPGSRSTHRKTQRRARDRAKAYGRYVSHWTDSTGTQRRLQALMCLGYDPTWVSEQVGIQPETAKRLARQDGRQHVARPTAEAVEALYDRLWDKPRVGTDRGSRIAVARTVNRAKNRGYVPPMGWDDDAIDDPQAKPADPAYMDYQERCRLAREFLALGFDQRSAARSAQVSYKTVVKIKREEAA